MSPQFSKTLTLLALLFSSQICLKITPKCRFCYPLSFWVSSFMNAPLGKNGPPDGWDNIGETNKIGPSASQTLTYRPRTSRYTQWTLIFKHEYIDNFGYLDFIELANEKVSAKNNWYQKTSFYQVIICKIPKGPSKSFFRHFFFWSILWDLIFKPSKKDLTHLSTRIF